MEKLYEKKLARYKVGLTISLMILMLCCAKIVKIDLGNEERVVDLVKAGCECKLIKPNEFLGVGLKKYAHMMKDIKQCIDNGLLDSQ